MTNPFGIGLAIAATASFAFAGGPDDDKKGDKSLLDNLFQGTKVTYSPGKGITFDGGDEYRVRLGGRIQPKWTFLGLETGRDVNTFSIRRARTKIDGHLWSKDITFYLQNDHVGGTSVLDAWSAWRFYTGEDAELRVRFGLGKFYGSRQFSNSSGSLEFTERSLATNTFSAARATGAILEGSALAADDGTNMLHFHAGAVNNDTAAGSGASNAEGLNNNNKLNWVFGARLDPQGDMGDLKFTEGDLDHTGNLQSSVAVDLHIGNDFVGGSSYENTTINLNGAVKTGSGIAAQGEVWIRTDDQDGGGDQDTLGWYVQGSYTTAPASTQWGLGVRISMVDIDTPSGGAFAPLIGPASFTALAGPGDVFEITGGVSAYYHKHLLKTQINYTFQSADPDGATASTDDHALDVMFTLHF